MRTERNKDGTWNVWMRRDEYRELPPAASSFQREVAVRLMGDCGLRVAETLDVTPGDIKRTFDGAHHLLHVRAGKDTTGEFESGKFRETWLPRDVEILLARFQQSEGIGEDEPFVDVGKRQVQNWVRDAADVAAERTGDDDYRKVSTHDLRRCWTNHLLVEAHVSPRTVMAHGGWSSYDATHSVRRKHGIEKAATVRRVRIAVNTDPAYEANCRDFGRRRRRPPGTPRVPDEIAPRHRTSDRRSSLGSTPRVRNEFSADGGRFFVSSPRRN